MPSHGQKMLQAAHKAMQTSRLINTPPKRLRTRALTKPQKREADPVARELFVKAKEKRKVNQTLDTIGHNSSVKRTKASATTNNRHRLPGVSAKDQKYLDATRGLKDGRDSESSISARDAWSLKHNTSFK